MSVRLYKYMFWDTQLDLLTNYLVILLITIYISLVPTTTFVLLADIAVVTLSKLLKQLFHPWLNSLLWITFFNKKEVATGMAQPAKGSNIHCLFANTIHWLQFPMLIKSLILFIKEYRRRFWLDNRQFIFIMALSLVL